MANEDATEPHHKNAAAAVIYHLRKAEQHFITALRVYAESWLGARYEAWGHPVTDTLFCRYVRDVLSGFATIMREAERGQRDVDGRGTEG